MVAYIYFLFNWVQDDTTEYVVAHRTMLQPSTNQLHAVIYHHCLADRSLSDTYLSEVKDESSELPRL